MATPHSKVRRQISCIAGHPTEGDDKDYTTDVWYIVELAIASQDGMAGT